MRKTEKTLSKAEQRGLALERLRDSGRVSLVDAGLILGFHHHTIRTYVAEGLIKAQVWGKRRWILASEIRAFQIKTKYGAKKSEIRASLQPIGGIDDADPMAVHSMPYANQNTSTGVEPLDPPVDEITHMDYVVGQDSVEVEEDYYGDEGLSDEEMQEFISGPSIDRGNAAVPQFDLNAVEELRTRMAVRARTHSTRFIPEDDERGGLDRIDLGDD